MTSGEDGSRSRRGFLHSRARSFGYAFAGLRYALGQPNFRIQILIGVAALILAAVIRVQSAEWLALILVSVAVLLMEMLNTAIEALVDLASPDYHPLARTVKDVTAGAVLLAALAAVIVGVYVFGPRLIHLVGWR
jgi:diacylglycerol kinase